MIARVALNSLRVVFGRTTVLQDVDFRVLAGECVQITGANGSGKSTLLRAMAGLVVPESGLVTLGPETVVGYVPDVPALYDMLTPKEQLSFVARMSESSVDVRTLLDRVGLSGEADLFSRDLSLGQRRRLSIAMALSLAPNLLLLDEPFNGLDLNGVLDVRSLVVNLLRSGGSVVVVQHGEVMSSVTRQVHLQQGVLADPTPSLDGSGAL